MANTKPVISIITPSYNRKEEIEHLVRSLQAQTVEHHLFEHIISDDGSTDGTRERVEDLRREVDFPLIFLTQENQGPGAARNHGIERARGDLLLFIDSDCEAHPEWVETIYREYTHRPFDACGGPDGAKSDFSALQQAINYAMTSFFTTGGMRGHSAKMLAKFYPRSHNMGMTRTLVEQVGGFGDLRHGQDIELSYRIRKAGADIRFIPGALVYHRRRTTLKRFFKQVFNWGVARINLGKIDSSLLEPIHFLPSLATIVMAYVLVGWLISPERFGGWITIGLLALLALGIHAAIQSRRLDVGLLTLVTIPIQIVGYGLGFISAFVRRYVIGQGVWTGFTKRYYS
ncbi:MAG: glycosyltransferase [Candidatus Neomarinimicrobiota bacterium]|nr:MAG: glycosyltransferase [Candidatus Neomarinimicrobiota bacterium]